MHQQFKGYSQGAEGGQRTHMGCPVQGKEWDFDDPCRGSFQVRIFSDSVVKLSGK